MCSCYCSLTETARLLRNVFSRSANPVQDAQASELQLRKMDSSLSICREKCISIQWDNMQIMKYKKETESENRKNLNKNKLIIKKDQPCTYIQYNTIITIFDTMQHNGIWYNAIQLYLIQYLATAFDIVLLPKLTSACYSNFLTAENFYDLLLSLHCASLWIVVDNVLINGFNNKKNNYENNCYLLNSSNEVLQLII